MSGRRQAKAKVNKSAESSTMFFTKKNYMILGIALSLLVVGFGGMYVEQEFTGWFSLYVSPVLIVAGFITVAFAILFKDTAQPESN
jgi:FtsH-binding integral membrane protein